ncbi:serine/threonine-protein phosphatase 4 regulatory subunit 2-B-like isoform X2 [Coregonus clupeaformis]|uniref:serine/threonine-protein phosphatase 4 regulatory subunit 2-B-like isoform X2 n=1 Tax=Coregonus clupeaformis TaxID=59861 RepID=UPI001E1C58ED|nr:serine/threonine-protein phosphatase 4 regulatory subunit 2-B-like isoform X2 [Coregonus clupeaformis]
MMEIDSLQEALKDFDNKGKKEVAPLLDQFLCHVAKTGETIVQWSQFKSYFLFKLEKVMDDFKASAPDQRGVANPNVESIPFEDMKERILKIVNGYNGIPFTIQRLCELLTEPKRNYTGTEKFLRGVEKNVMVVSCVHPTSEKVNGPGTPRPLNRPKLSLATNGLPDSTENKDPTTEQGHDKPSSEVSASSTLGSSVKNKHHDDDEEEDMEAEQHEVKRLKFNEEDEEEGDTLRPGHTDSLSKEAESMVQEEEEDDDKKKSEAPSTAGTCEDQEPSSTQLEPSADPGENEQAEREVPCGSQEECNDMDQSEQQAPAGVLESPEARDSDEGSDPVSSSSSSVSSSSSEEIGARKERAPAPSSSTPEPPAEGAMESGSLDTGTSEEPMEQD